MQIKRHLSNPDHHNIFLVSFFLTLFISAFIAIHQALVLGETRLLSASVVTVEFDSSVLDTDGPSIETLIKSKDPAIESVVFVGKQQALEQAQKDPSLAKSLMLLKDNPLLPIASVRFQESAWTERDPLQSLNGIPKIQQLHWNPSIISLLRGVSQWRRVLDRVAGISFAGMLLWLLASLLNFIEAHYPFQNFWPAILFGTAGAAVACGWWRWMLNQLFSDGAAFLPGHLSLLPLLTGIIVGAALGRWKTSHEI